MSDLILCWRGGDDDTEPVACRCAVFGYPNRTTTGEQMFANTHFLTREEAWTSIERSVAAQLSSSVERWRNRKELLRRAEADLVAATVRSEDARKAREMDRG